MPFPQPRVPKKIFFGFNGPWVKPLTGSGKFLRSRYEKCQQQQSALSN